MSTGWGRGGVRYILSRVLSGQVLSGGGEESMVHPVWAGPVPGGVGGEGMGTSVRSGEGVRYILSRSCPDSVWGIG